MAFYSYNYHESAQTYGQAGYGCSYPKPAPNPEFYSEGFGNKYDSNQQAYQGWPSGIYQNPYGYYGNRNGYGSQTSELNRLETQGYRADTVVQTGGTKTNTMTTSISMDDPFGEIVPSAFPEGTDPKLIQSFNMIDKNGDGVIDDRELQSVLSSCGQAFEMRTVHLLMYMFTSSSRRMIGPREFAPLYKSLQSWKAVFQRSDANRNGRIDVGELRSALYSIGYSVSPAILNLLVAKFARSKESFSIGFDNFIECCLTVKGLTEKFRAKENPSMGTATFTYDEFLVTVLPFIIA
ncbi:hypothetical protein Ancab_031046 [Ancistrocladus abbreviatus]